MDANIQQHDRFYRRGLVLGVTMAEIMVLVLFALLLALAAALARKEALLGQFRHLQEQYGAVRLEDVFTKLQKQEEEIAALTAERRGWEAAREKAKITEDVFAELKRQGESEASFTSREIVEKLRLAKAVEDAGKKSGNALRPDELRALVESVVAAREALEKNGDKLDAQGLAKLIADAREAATKYRDVLGQNRNLEAQLARVGKGGDLPPCWPTETGKAEYIFDVTITPTGLVIATNEERPEMQHRRAAYGSLPISQIKFATELSQAEFRRQTIELRRWGERQEQQCRFYVRLIDSTRPDQKAEFKRFMLTTGENFYYYLVQ